MKKMRSSSVSDLKPVDTEGSAQNFLHVCIYQPPQLVVGQNTVLYFTFWFDTKTVVMVVLAKNKVKHFAKTDFCKQKLLCSLSL